MIAVGCVNILEILPRVYFKVLGLGVVRVRDCTLDKQ